MANCAGRWKSSLTFLVSGGVTVPNPVSTDDLMIEIDPHAATTFTGRYLSGTPVNLENTACVTQPGGTPFISFTRSLDNVLQLRYTGRIVNRLIIGEFVIERKDGGTEDG